MSKERYITSFFAPPEAFVDGFVTLPEDEARHATRALRLNVGSSLTIVDGKGGWYSAVLTSVGRDTAVAQIEEKRVGVGEPDYELVLAIGVLKSRSRFEVFLEKAVELGVTAIIPIRTARSEESSVNQRRCDAVVLAAMKQSGRSVLPEVRPVATFGDVLSLDGLQLLCHEGAERESTISDAVGNFHVSPVVISIGPEGGFSDGEVSEAKSRGARVVSLGSRRLRAETAGIVAVAMVAAQLDKLSN